MRRIGLLCLCLMVSAAAVQAQNVGEKGTIHGLAYSDYYWVASNHIESLEGSNGFWFRRIYLGYDYEHSDTFSSRIRFEMNSEGDFVSGGNMMPFVKDAWIKWENDQHEILGGISPTPTFSLVESVWGYRAVEKTPLDLQGMAGSRDLGVAAKGALDTDGRWNYHAMVGNGNSTGPEIDQGKKVMLAVSHQLTDEWVVEVYGDWNNMAGDQYWNTVQGFAGYESDEVRFGAMYARQHRANTALGDHTINVASLFATSAFSDRTTGFLRVDHLFDPNPAGEDIAYIPFNDDTESTLLIGGLDLELDDNIHLMPNIETVVYGETPTGETPGTDLIPRLTLFYQF